MLQASNISVFRNDLSGLPLIFSREECTSLTTLLSLPFSPTKKTGFFFHFLCLKMTRKLARHLLQIYSKKKRFSTPVAVSHVSVRWFIFQPSQVFLMAPFIDKDLNGEKLHFVNKQIFNGSYRK